MEGGFFFKINKCDSTFIREMRVLTYLLLIQTYNFKELLDPNTFVDFLKMRRPPSLMKRFFDTLGAKWKSNDKVKKEDFL